MAKAMVMERPRRVDDDAAVQRAQETLHRAKTLLGQAESELHASKAQTAGDVLAAIEAGGPVSTAPDTAALRQRVETLRQAEAAAAAKVAEARLKAGHEILQQAAGELAEADEAVGVALSELSSCLDARRRLRERLTQAGCDWQHARARQRQFRFLREDAVASEAADWQSRANGRR